MKFDKNDIADINTLTCREAKDYIEFLEVEIRRHQDEELSASYKAAYARTATLSALWWSARNRHQKDIEKAYYKIFVVKRWWDL